MKIKRNKDTIRAYKAKKPKINSGKNTCWSDTSVMLNGVETGIFWECMRGANYYFAYNNQWYKIPFVIGSCFNAVDNLNDNIEYMEEWSTI